MTKGEHPNCLACNKPLRRYRWRNQPWAQPNAGYGGYGDGLFCGKSCGHDFAIVAVANLKSGKWIKNPEVERE